MKKAVDVIKDVLEEELDVISAEKRNVVAARIAKELHLGQQQVLSTENLPEKSGSFDPR